MYQVNFSNQSMAVLNKLPKLAQLDLVETISRITPERLHSGHPEIGTITREGKTFYRIRKEDFRVYFEIHDDILFCNYILHKHSRADFIFRMKLPFDDELENDPENLF
ncbi:MAG: cytotoxic translational repressor of toxin-antitoxin stability system [Puniceicoccales bacterium]|jgi:mRNA-degrading endonuclease RelE of RelBE toxin-antitoxin system|nr:cytotoxic translational repressor of toxin-antitoxin stability system [Puniceicoccales bacterium]